MAIEVFEVTAEQFVSAYVKSDGSWHSDAMVEACGVLDGEDYDDDPDYQETVLTEAESLAGWYYWFCHPGCLPESEPFGPYSDRDEAWVHACDSAEIPLPIEISSDVSLFDEDGSFTGPDHWESHPWGASVVVYCYDKARARWDQSIDGDSWECPSDMDVAYACLTICGAAGEDPDLAFDALVERMKADGYDVSVD